MVTVYTTPTCGFCKMAKQYLKSQGVDYTEKDITSDGDAYKEVLDLSNQRGVPVLNIGGTIIIGFNRPAIDASLRSNKLI